MVPDRYNVTRYCCSQCDYASTSAEELNSHVRSKHDTCKRFACSFCTYRTNSAENLGFHEKASHKKKR